MSAHAALVFTLLAAGVGAFQLALLCGAPWGELTLGGRWPGRLPAKVRLIPLVSLLLLAGLAAVVLARAGLALPGLGEQADWLVWGVVGYCALGCLANAATPSRRERRLWLPVVIAMLICSLVVAWA
jgi:hypothetical protein